MVDQASRRARMRDFGIAVSSCVCDRLLDHHGNTHIVARLDGERHRDKRSVHDDHKRSVDA